MPGQDISEPGAEILSLSEGRMKYDAGSIEHGPEIAHVSFRVVWNDDNCIVLTDDAPFLNEPACFRVQRQPGPPGSLLG